MFKDEERETKHRIKKFKAKLHKFFLASFTVKCVIIFSALLIIGLMMIKKHNQKSASEDCGCADSIDRSGKGVNMYLPSLLHQLQHQRLVFFRFIHTLCDSLIVEWKHCCFFTFRVFTGSSIWKCCYIVYYTKTFNFCFLPVLSV